MPTQVLIPPLGQTVDTLVFVHWYRQEGELVQQGEPLFAVETDKATLDVEAPASGVLRQVAVKPGQEVQTLSAIAVIGDDTRQFSSPRARRLAEQAGVSLTGLAGTGPSGAIVERDVQAYLGAQAAELAAVQRTKPPAMTPVARRLAEETGLDWQQLLGTGPSGRITRQDVEQALAQVPQVHPSPHDASVDLFDAIPMSGIRAIIAERMASSHHETAPVTLTAEADATELVGTRRRLSEQGVAASYNALLLAILARALREHPRLNASLDGEVIKLWRRVDIGLAVDTDRGLLVPVVRDVDKKGVAAISAEAQDLAERVRDGKITPDELRGSTFTLTNLGMLGVDAFTPIINRPETAILGVGRIKEKPAVYHGQIVTRQLMWVSLTFDHRLVDGGLAARFLQRVVQLVEQPILLLA